jgi:hypothetical protein
LLPVDLRLSTCGLPNRRAFCNVAFYVSLTPDKDVVFDVDGFADWWTKIQALRSFKETQPDLG